MSVDRGTGEDRNRFSVSRFVDELISRSVRAGASDIHFEPFEDAYFIRMRVDGALYELTSPPPGLGPEISSRLKIAGDLNIAEKRLPQDGRLFIMVDGRSIELRISTLPTLFGESIVLRILDQSKTQLNLDNLGMPAGVAENVRRLVHLPNGIFIVTGPTGCGKTTTLYSALSELNRLDIKILTAEDPVEYEIDGIVQVAINPRLQLNFASVLRSFLRQDPDKIMVGEVRDFETAQMAIQASLTGHLVLTTLHTNDAPGAVLRLLDMGVEAYLLAATLEGVLAQRLVRRICPDCRIESTPSQDLLSRFGFHDGNTAKGVFYEGSGCDRCLDSGYRGRMGLFELMRVDGSIRELISNRVVLDDLKQAAINQGMTPLSDCGFRAACGGKTTLDEVLHYTELR